MFQLARLGFVLVGVHAVLFGLASLPQLLPILRGSSDPDGLAFWSLALFLVVLFSILPSIGVIAFSGALARRFDPDSDPPPERWTLSTLLTVVVAVAGMLSVLGGVSGLSGAIVMLAASSGTAHSFGPSTLGMAVGRILGGGVVFWYAAAIVHRIPGVRSAS